MLYVPCNVLVHLTHLSKRFLGFMLYVPFATLCCTIGSNADALPLFSFAPVQFSHFDFSRFGGVRGAAFEQLQVCN